MKVKQLLAILEDCDPEANVLIMSQPNYPTEHTLYGIAIRREFEEDPDAYEIADEDGEPKPYEDGKLSNDVLLIEGTHTRYGDKAAWDAAKGR